MRKVEELTLGERLKEYEFSYEKVVDSEKHIVIRIDGHKFSKYTIGFKKPFDDILSCAMIETSKALLKEFKASIVYTQSDEITLIVPSYQDQTEDNRKTKSDKKRNKVSKRISKKYDHNLGGRVQKLCSLTASFTTMVFNRTLRQLVLKAEEEMYQTDYEKSKEMYFETLKEKFDMAWFDSRVFAVCEKEELFNALLWRVRDAEKNSKSMAAYTYLPHKDLLGLTGEQRVEMLKERKGIDWNKYPDKFKYGIFMKKRLYEKEIEGDEQTCFRTTIEDFSEKMTFSQKNVEMVYKKYLD